MRPYLYMLAAFGMAILLSSCSVVGGLAVGGASLIWDAAHPQGGKGDDRL